MKPFKQNMAETLESSLEKELLVKLPSGFQATGDIAVLSLQPELRKYEKKICSKMLKLYPKFKTICIKVDAVKRDTRLPSIKRICGNGTETVHSENGCLYKLDVTKVMFSKGNTRERGRLAAIVRKDETIVDMFCGIGYFSIPIAKAGAKKVYALDVNPIAVKYLKENIKLNKIMNIEPICCDNRGAPAYLNGVADRVLMGYLPGTEKFLDYAFLFLKKQGGIIHFHDIYRDDELWRKPVSVLRKYGKAHVMKLKILEKHVVKQYSPHMQHVVIDADFSPLR